MITLYTFGPYFGLPDPSPFVMKAEMLLKTRGLEYQTNTKGFMRAPKGKLPYIEDNGAIVADSTLIRLHLEQKHGIDFDRGLSPRERGIAWATEKMLEDHLYWHADLLALDERRQLRARTEEVLRARAGVDPAAGHEDGPQARPREPAWAWHRPAQRSGDTLMPRAPSSRWRRCWATTSTSWAPEPCGADATAFAFVAGALCQTFDSPLRTQAARP